HDDCRHAGEICDVAGRAPGVELEMDSRALRTDERERAERRKVAEQARVCLGLDAPPVWGDNERERWVVLRAVPAWEHDEGRAPLPVESAIADLPRAHEVLVPD